MQPQNLYRIALGLLVFTLIVMAGAYDNVFREAALLRDLHKVDAGRIQELAWENELLKQARHAPSVRKD